jgi:hypothetical protein
MDSEHGFFRCRQLLMLPMYVGGYYSGPPQGSTVYRWRLADDVQRYWHHGIDTRSAVAVRCKIAYYPIEAVKFHHKTLK